MRGLLALFLLGSGFIVLQAAWPYLVASFPYFFPVFVLGTLLSRLK